MRHGSAATSAPRALLATSAPSAVVRPPWDPASQPWAAEPRAPEDWARVCWFLGAEQRGLVSHDDNHDHGSIHVTAFGHETLRLRRLISILQ